MPFFMSASPIRTVLTISANLQSLKVLLENECIFELKMLGMFEYYATGLVVVRLFDH